MKALFALIFAATGTAALAHPGHVEEVAGHSHYDHAAIIVAILAIAVAGAVLLHKRRP